MIFIIELESETKSTFTLRSKMCNKYGPQGSATVNTQVPNELRLEAERLPKRALDRYKVARKATHVYKAAAKLWAEGLQWSRALAIVQEAFDEIATEE